MTDLDVKQLEITNSSEIQSEKIPKKFLWFDYLMIGKIIEIDLRVGKAFIGPHWYCFVILNVFAFALGLFMYFKLFCFLNLLYRVFYVTIVVAAYVIYWLNFLSYPGIAQENTSNRERVHFCNVCQLHVPEDTYHCNFCDVCIEKHDHHCIWVGKCIGKNNLKIFYILIASMCLFYPYVIISTLYYYFHIVK